MQCPYCKEEVHDEAIKCKHCGSSLIYQIKQLTPPHHSNDFGEAFMAAFNLWKGNLSDLVLVSLIFILICWVPVVNIAFIAGYTRSLSKVARGQGKARVSDLFGAWNCFGSLLVYLLLYFIAALILHFVPIIGTISSLALCFLALPGVFLIIDRNKGAIDAFKWSIESIQADFLNWLMVYLVSNVIFFTGFMVLVICSVLTMPLAQLLIIQQYERVKPS